MYKDIRLDYVVNVSIVLISDWFDSIYGILIGGTAFEN